MAELPQGFKQEAPRAAGNASALAELMEGAKALQTIQAIAAQDALRLPNPRLDQPEGPTFFNIPNGDGTFTRVDPNGEPFKG